MAENVSVALSRGILDTAADIPCGGRPIMELQSLRDVAAAHPALRDALPEGPPGSADPFVAAAVGPAAESLGSCAIVGNSGSLLGAGQGCAFPTHTHPYPHPHPPAPIHTHPPIPTPLPATHSPEIDAHDFVLRFNAAPTAGFAADVGRRTTARLQNVDTLGWGEPGDKVLIFSARSAKARRGRCRVPATSAAASVGGGRSGVRWRLLLLALTRRPVAPCAGLCALRGAPHRPVQGPPRGAHPPDPLDPPTLTPIHPPLPDARTNSAHSSSAAALAAAAPLPRRRAPPPPPSWCSTRISGAMRGSGSGATR